MTTFLNFFHFHFHRLAWRRMSPVTALKRKKIRVKLMQMNQIKNLMKSDVHRSTFLRQQLNHIRDIARTACKSVHVNGLLWMKNSIMSWIRKELRDVRVCDEKTMKQHHLIFRLLADVRTLVTSPVICLDRTTWKLSTHHRVSFSRLNVAVYPLERHIIKAPINFQQLLTRCQTRHRLLV